MATYIQAMGRIERVWREVVNQNVFMNWDVFNDFATFYIDESYYEIQEKRKNRISNNLLGLISQVKDQARKINRQAKRRAEAGLTSQEAKCRSSIHELLKQLERYRSGADTEAKDIWLRLRKSALRHDFADEVLNEYHATFSSTFYENGLLYIDQENRVYHHNLRIPTARRWRLNSVYDVIKENNIISRHFLNRGYELEFSQSTNFFFTPYFYQAILVGAIGEEAIEVLLKSNLVLLDDDIPHELFELADIKIADKPWYIDCKNYSERTLDQFPLDEDDPAYHPSLSEKTFEAKVRSKLRRIRAYHQNEQDNCKLIYLNLVSSEHRSLRYINSSNYEENTTFDEADVIIVQGILHPDKPNELSSSFKQVLDDYAYRT
ncbi:MAG: hypothetical protein AAFY41_12490 [Bacteroidota bacterium]